ncbi:MAG: glutathione S-transferase [Burkholderiales bacterium]
MTLQLCGFAASNYYNKVKIALLEKGVPFEEVNVYTPVGPEHRPDTPMGKVPFLRTPAGPLAESQVIVEYLEDAFPEKPLYPRDVFARAKTREIVAIMEINVELVMRRLYGAAFFGGQASDALKAEVEPVLRRGCLALARVASFDGFIDGGAFSVADCAAVVHLPMLGSVSRDVLGTDLLTECLPGAREYLKRLSSRESITRTNADRKAGYDAFIEHRRALAAR